MRMWRPCGCGDHASCLETFDAGDGFLTIDLESHAARVVIWNHHPLRVSPQESHLLRIICLHACDENSRGGTSTRKAIAQMLASPLRRSC